MLNNILKNMLAIGTSLFLQFSLRLGLKKAAGFSYLNTICCNLFFDCSIVHEKIWPHTICDFYSLFRLVCYCIRFFLKVCCNEPPTILSINILYSITLNSAVLWIKFWFCQSLTMLETRPKTQGHGSLTPPPSYFSRSVSHPFK